MPVFIASDQEAIGARIRDVLTFGGKACPPSHVLPIDEAAHRLARESEVELVVVALPPDRERGLAVLPTLARIASGRVLAVGPATDAKVVLQALRAGAQDFVDSADLEAELEAAVRRLAEGAAGAPEQGRLIALLAPNGGSGSSTLAVNIAAGLAKEHGHIGLLDLKLESGDLAPLLDVRPTFTIADLCQNAARLDRVMFERSLVKHDSGVNLLAAPQHLADLGNVRPEGVGLAVSLARACFPYVVADMDCSFREEQMVALRQADVILVVMRLEFTSLRNVRRTLEYLDSLDISREKVQLVVNRHGQPQEVPRAKAEEALGMKVAHFIPEDAKTINRANNHGTPVILSEPKAKVSRSLAQLAQSVNGKHKA